SLNFIVDESLPADYDAQNSSVSQTPVTGTPAGGAIVSATDGLSSPVVANSSGTFQLVSIATGTWSVTISSGILYTDRTSIAVTANTTTPLGTVGLTSSTANGYISGRVEDSSNNPINGVQVAASGGSATTASDGTYRFSIATGTYEVTANPGNTSAPSYTSEITTGVVVNTGQITSNVNFTLSDGGKFSGFATTNGTDPFPGVVFDAKLSGTSEGTGLSGADGKFLIPNLPVGTYEVDAYAPSGEDVSPSTKTASVVGGTTVFVDTFTVSGAFGKIKGSLTTGGSAPIKTGVLVIASTATISGTTPPTMNNSLRSGGIFYYAGSSLADGSYSISLPGATYNVYAWYSTYIVNVATTTKKSGSATVAAGGSATIDFNW
ncbi:MAG: carboxypeptidase regulatory-like domain-containing protein, partial [Elusimicrobia bacterium]|nr:carboxypeptidase regulatory-like domain-containing protein [Elusimicrobiota bacterium]